MPKNIYKADDDDAVLERSGGDPNIEMMRRLKNAIIQADKNSGKYASFSLKLALVVLFLTFVQLATSIISNGAPWWINAISITFLALALLYVIWKVFSIKDF